MFLEITTITPLGKSMAAFPLSPHYAKMLCLSKDRSLLQYMLFIISAMSVQEYLPGDHVEAWKKTKLSWVDKGESLLLGKMLYHIVSTLIIIVGGYNTVIKYCYVCIEKQRNACFYV